MSSRRRKNASRRVSDASQRREGDALSPLESLKRFLRDSGVSVSDAIEIIEDVEDRDPNPSTSKTSTSASSPPSPLPRPIKVVLSRSPSSPSATADSVAPGTLLARIPKDTAVLSARNSAAREPLEEEKIGGGLALLLAILTEVALADRSPFFDYLRSLPPRGEYLPVLWPRRCREELLRGTSLSPEALEADRGRVLEDWLEEGAPFFARHGARLLGGGGGGVGEKEKEEENGDEKNPFSLRSFLVAATWAASRAFGVDDDHGQALVPLADAFNHKAAVVELRAGGGSGGGGGGGGSGGGKRKGKRKTAVAFEVERACLEEEESGSEEAESEESESEEEDNGEEEEDDADESESESESVVCFAPPRSDGLALDIAICGCDDSGVDSLAIYAASELKPKGESGSGGGGDESGKRTKTTTKATATKATTTPETTVEIFNCYGELGNRELLSKYGFCLRQNPFDSVALRPRLLLLEQKKEQQHLSSSSSSSPPSSSSSSSLKSNGKGGGGKGEEEELRKLRRLLRRRARWLRARSDLLDDGDEGGGELAITAGFGKGGEDEEEEEDRLGDSVKDGNSKKRRKKQSSLFRSSSSPPPAPLVVPTLSPGLRAVLTVLCAPEGERERERGGERRREKAEGGGAGGGGGGNEGGDDDDDDDLQRLLAPRWWLREQQQQQEQQQKQHRQAEDDTTQKRYRRRRRRRRPPLLGPLPLTERALASADPPLPTPLSLEVLSLALRDRIEEFGAEPDYKGVLARWRQAAEEEGGKEEEDDGDIDGRASRAVRACSLLRSGELSLLREALRACESLPAGNKKNEMK